MMSIIYYMVCHASYVRGQDAALLLDCSISSVTHCHHPSQPVMHTSSSPEMMTSKSAGDKPGWLRLAWQFLRRPRLDPISMIGDNKSIMAFNLIWMFDKVCK